MAWGKAEQKLVEKASAAAAKAAKKAKTQAEHPGGGDATKRGKRRPAPQTGGVNADAPEPEQKRIAFDIGDGTAVHQTSDDSWDLVGQELKVHESFWDPDYEGQMYTTCTVVGYIGKYEFPEQSTSRHTYVIECEGHCYPARHTTVADGMVDEAAKRRLRKAPAPHAV